VIFNHEPLRMLSVTCCVALHPHRAAHIPLTAPRVTALLHLLLCFSWEFATAVDTMSYLFSLGTNSHYIPPFSFVSTADLLCTMIACSSIL
jgi:hypothetical protein